MAFIKQAAHELGIKEEIIRRDVGKVLFKLEELQRRADQKGACSRRKRRSR